MPRLPFTAVTLLAGGALAMLGGCATTPADGPVEVTRFHVIDASHETRGTIRIVSASDKGPTLEEAPYIAAIADALVPYKFSVLRPDDPTNEAIGRVSVIRTRIRPERSRSRVSLGGAGSTGSYGSGVGLGIGIDLSGRPPEQIETLLTLTIDDASNGKRLWEGRARQIVSVKSPLASPSADAQHMAEALLAGFPGHSGETILVK